MIFCFNLWEFSQDFPANMDKNNETEFCLLIRLKCKDIKKLKTSSEELQVLIKAVFASYITNEDKVI